VSGRPAGGGRIRVALAVALAVGTALVAPAAAPAQLVLEQGHVDAVAPVYAGGALALTVKDGTGAGGPVIRAPGDVVLRVRPEARMAVPSGLPASFAFLGAPGATIWLLPQVQSDNPAVVWAGWSSESIPAGQFVGDQLQWRLLAVEGPGPVQMYETDPFGGPRLFFDSADGLPDTEPRPTGVHSHFNWVFHAAGAHRLTFEVAGTPVGAPAPVTSGPVQYSFDVVGEGGGEAPPPPPGGGGQGGPQAPKPAPPRLAARIQAAKVVGRTATLRLRVNHRSRVAVVALRGRRVVARSKWRALGPAQRRLRVRLGKALAPGRYRLRVVVRSGGRRIVRHRAVRIRPRARGAAATAAGTSAVAVAAARGATVLDDGHIDYGARIVDGRLASQVKDGTKGADAVVWREPSQTVLHLVDGARSEIPAGGLDFLGAAGAAVWMSPQVQKQGVVWAGWNTEDRSLNGVRGAVTWRLLAVDGPGEFAIFQTGSFGQPEVVFATKDGLPDSYSIPLGVHAHGNWAFTEAGVYRLRFEMSAAVGGARQSDTETLTVVVGDGDPSAVDPAVGSDGHSPGGGSGGGSGGGDEDFAVGGEAGASGAGDGGGGGDDGLPHTGAELAPLAVAGLALLAVGIALRRRTGAGRAVARP